MISVYLRVDARSRRSVPCCGKILPLTRGSVLEEQQRKVCKMRYGERNSIRLDVADFDRKSKTLCIMDAKTGIGMRIGLSAKRIEELVQDDLVQDPETERFVIVQMRPRPLRPRR